MKGDELPAEADEAIRQAAEAGGLTLRPPEEFDTATRFIRPEDMRKSVSISSDLGWHTAKLATLFELGVEEIQLHQVGRNQQAFIEVFRQLSGYRHRIRIAG